MTDIKGNNAQIDRQVLRRRSRPGQRTWAVVRRRPKAFNCSIVVNPIVTMMIQKNGPESSRTLGSWFVPGSALFRQRSRLSAVC
jgi:hypothetical protein